MRNVAVSGDQAIGSVVHHAGHIIGTDLDGNPIFCTGHAVVGSFASKAKLQIQGRPVLSDGLSGSTNCACDGGSALLHSQAKLRVSNRSVSTSGDSADFHGAGQGELMSTKNRLRVR